jgi:hypothetical protein
MVSEIIYLRNSGATFLFKKEARLGDRSTIPLTSTIQAYQPIIISAKEEETE